MIERSRVTGPDFADGPEEEKHGGEGVTKKREDEVEDEEVVDTPELDGPVGFDPPAVPGTWVQGYIRTPHSLSTVCDS